jgi:class 3 adenylate cyclase
VSRIGERIFGPDWGIRSMDGYSAPNSIENRDDIAKFVVPIVGGVGLAGLVGWLAIPITGEHIPETHVKTLLAILTVGLFTIGPAFWFARRKAPLWAIHIAGIGTIADLVLLTALAGPVLMQLVGIAFIPVFTVLFVIMRRRLAVTYGVIASIAYGLVLGLRQHKIAPYTMWIDTVGALLLVGIVVAGLVERSRLHVRREHEAVLAAQRAQAEAEQAREAIAELNHTLEVRVAEQVNELDRMSKLRRFLSPQVAERMLAADDESILEPHRKEIAVFYCDLRGFTRFATGAEPEDLVDILDDYYQTVGELIRSFNATLGTFAGDGIMAYFNDPVPCLDPAYQAVEMALALREPMGTLIESWKEEGYDLGYGVGVAYGYATLGMVGFESRNDYTAVGSVVNLASRLCSEAHAGEILIDSRAEHAIAGRIDSEPCTIILKGIPTPVSAFVILDPSEAIDDDEAELDETRDDLPVIALQTPGQQFIRESTSWPAEPH